MEEVTIISKSFILIIFIIGVILSIIKGTKKSSSDKRYSDSHRAGGIDTKVVKPIKNTHIKHEDCLEDITINNTSEYKTVPQGYINYNGKLIKSSDLDKQ